MDNRVQIGTLCGSLRRASCSASLARALPALAPESVEIVALPSLGDIPLFNQDIIDHSGVPAAVAALAEAVAAMDAVIIVSPEYNWSIPGVLKNAFDWLSRLASMPLSGKPTTIFTISPGLLGGARAHAPIRNVLHALDCQLLARPEVQVARAVECLDVETDRIRDPATAEFLTQRLQAFASFAVRHRGAIGE